MVTSWFTAFYAGITFLAGFVIDRIPALIRFDRDILGQHGVKWLIISEGINDIGGTKDNTQAVRLAKDLIEAYKQMIDKAHAKGIKVYGATILPLQNLFTINPYAISPVIL